MLPSFEPPKPSLGIVKLAHEQRWFNPFCL
jgi:hypothetical protein